MNGQTIIIGAGVIGLSIARELHRRGMRRLIVLDRGRAGTEASWAAAGMLSPQAEADNADTFFRFCSHARDQYPLFAKQLYEETGIDIELDQTGTVSIAFSDDQLAELKARFEWQRSLGLEVQLAASEELAKLEPALSNRSIGGVIFPTDWQVENRKLVEALIEYARRNQIEIIGHTNVSKLDIKRGRVFGVETSSGNIPCDSAILAAGAWTSLIDNVPILIEPVRGQMICFRPEQPLIKHVIYGPRGYLVPRRDGRILAGATVENVGFDDDVTVEGTETLRQMALEMVPALGNLNITDSWSGLRPFASDGLPVLGYVPGIENLTVASGHFRNGILLAPLTAEIIADLILDKRESEFLKAFSPSRKTELVAGR